MLSRAATNAYSWWWASHIRTKQSKWLEQNIEDMEEKVEYILKIITEDGDSFRVRAEQYYRKRHEIVNFVEDTFREYRALAERYDHISKDLQSANRTIAAIFPERVQMSIDEDDYEDFAFSLDESEYKFPTTTGSPLPLPLPLPEVPKLNHLPKMENVVQAMINKKSKKPMKMMSKKGLIKIGVDENAPGVTRSSGLSKDEVLEEIDVLQKDILGLQTEKEFIKSSYKNSIAMYWEIENNINEMHTKISKLQDEVEVGTMIEDNDARTIMSSSALKMCAETLDKLKHKQKRFKKEATVEHKRVDEIRKKFEALIASNNDDSDLKNLEQTGEHVKDKKAKIEEKQLKSLEGNDAILIQQEPLQNPDTENSDHGRFVEDTEDKKARIKEEILETNDEPITVSQVAVKIEQLVDKVISLESEVTSQTALVMRLRLENDELHEHIQSLEEEKKTLVDDSKNMNMKIKRLEEELERVQILDQIVKGQNVQLETSFDEASVNLDTLSKDLLIAKPDETAPEEENVFGSYKSHQYNLDEKFYNENPRRDSEKDESDDVFGTCKSHHHFDENVKDENPRKDSKDENPRKDSKDLRDCISKPREKDESDDVDRNVMFSYGVEDREKLLLEEYTATLENYKEVKKKLNEIEKRNRASTFKYAVQIKMLRNSNDSKDAQLRSLYEKLKLFEPNMEKTLDYGLKKAPYSVDVHTERRIEPEETTDFELKKRPDSVDEETRRRKKLDEIADLALKKALDSFDEGTQRRKEHEETTNFELEKSLDSADEGTHIGKELDETTNFDLKNAPDLVDEETQRIKDPGKEIQFELQKAPDSVHEETQQRKELDDDANKAHEVLEIEEEIRTEIEELRKENLELWMRFSTSYHQINRFQDSFTDLLQEIKEMKEKKHEHKNAKEHHHQHRNPSFASDIRPLYRHLQDMLTEMTLWLEKSGILEDDLQHRLTSLSDIQNELSDLTNDNSETKKITTTTLDDFQAAKFQGEVLNMKQENIKVLDELKVASKRVKNLQLDIEETLTTLDEELGKKKRSRSSSKVPFKSFLFGVKLRKHKPSLFARMSPSLQRQYSGQQPLPQPKEES